MPKGSGFTQPKKLSAELADIVGVKEASRAECVKLLWAYLKKHELQVWKKLQFMEATLLPWRNGLKGKLNKVFLHFMPNFCHIWWFFKVECTDRCCGTLKKTSNNKYDKNLTKIEEKPCSTYMPSNHFLADSVYPKIRFRVPVPTLI